MKAHPEKYPRYSSFSEAILSNRFRRDLKLAAKRGRDLKLLDDVVTRLAQQEPLPEKNRDHSLTGDYIGFRECHIQPDWLLIYRIDGEALILFLSRTGTHSDLLF
ncbi:MAG: type II toxin-antitoxin system YafQ family toxin [Oscillospiraceae bacterium]|nr:type II toxin-antitoxin system YafQ family toxin [Oscillospiraceae bacterium]